MQPLEKSLRNKLERTVKDARDIAEDAAKASLDQLGVGEASPFAHLSEADRDLRRRLRIHGRQLGDTLNGGKIQIMDRLMEEVAYEHWHRMLFARFLAENNLLMYPDPLEPVPVTLEECEDLAPDEGAKNGWELAARFAARMLPQIFRTDSPVFQLTLPPEHQQKLEKLLADLPAAVFTASDSLGWVYQFWQAKRKDAVNASEVKIGARELPAVTQLFTEPYMVAFLLDNSLGAWWVAHLSGLHDGIERKQGAKKKLEIAATEAELREFFALPGVPLEYLRFVKVPSPLGGEGQGEGEIWTPAAGTFEGWPNHLSELKTLDPCCGSGHFLVAVFLMLVAMRRELEGLSPKDAVDAVLRENIHGLEIDQRCVELAAFALALAAWKYPDAGGYRPLPELNVACSGLSVSVAKDGWKQLGLGKKNLTIALDWMHDTFKDAPVLGSLLDPAKTNAAKIVQWDELSSALEQALKLPSPDGRGAGDEGYEQQEVAVVAQGLAKAATLLAARYQWVMTNVPYLARGKQNERLKDFCEKHYPAAKNDLATVFLDRCLELCVQAGTASIVLPQNWLFLTTYKKFREKLLKNDTWHLIARLGEGGFDSSAAAGAFVAMISLSHGNSTKESGGLFGDFNDGNRIRGVDVSEPRPAAEKAAQLLTTEIKSVAQARQLDNPDAAIVFDDSLGGAMLLTQYAKPVEGAKTIDIERFRFLFWEFDEIYNHWNLHNSSPTGVGDYSGLHYLSISREPDGPMASLVDEYESLGKKVVGWLCGKPVWGKKGISVAWMRDLPSSIYLGSVYDNSAAALIPENEQHFAAVYCYLKSEQYPTDIRKINQKIQVATTTLGKVPFDLDHWTRIAAEKYPNGLPKPYSDDPTQWIFHGHPCGSVIWDAEKKWTAYGPLRTDATVLQVAVARLLGYRWPAELDPGMKLADEQREWVSRCESLSLTPALSQGERGPLVDKDGIVCIPPVRGESSAADRLLNLLAAAFGDAWSGDTLARLLASADHAGKTLETWLRDKFFTQHCKLFQHRPFIWHVWDGLHDGFAALVNYHKLDRKKLETLIYTYLGDWISRQKQDITAGIDGAQEKLDAALSLKKKLELILEGEAPYDIFVRWKPLDQQPIGWNPDLNDGVRLNIRPFMSVPDVGKRGAGCLRDKPNIKWEKDRGKDVASAPWYHLFNGDRINDHHLTLAGKKASRGVSN